LEEQVSRDWAHACGGSGVMNNGPAYGISGLFMSFPAWSLFIDHGWAVFISILGALVLITTLRKNILDVRIKRIEKALLELEMEKRK
jgi:hypothetical protein